MRGRALILLIIGLSWSLCAFAFQTVTIGSFGTLAAYHPFQIETSSASNKRHVERRRNLQMNVFGNLFEQAMLKIVEVKEKDSTKKKLQPCPFCDETVDGFAGLRKGSGKQTCSSCKGKGIDAALGSGTCYLCDGKGTVSCGVCLGTGLVDRVRRGGTDVAGKWVGTDKVMDPLSPQYAPYILELDGGERYVFCQCGVSTRQPFCDSASHRAYGIKPLPFTAQGEKGSKTKAALCGCKYSNTKPYCDGTRAAMARAEADNASK